MPRLIELQNVQECRGAISIRVDDVLLIPASGGRVESGASLEVGGPYNVATAIDTGEVLTATGAPHTILVWARTPGQAALEVTTGDPWRQTQMTLLRINVE